MSVGSSVKEKKLAHGDWGWGRLRREDLGQGHGVQRPM